MNPLRALTVAGIVGVANLAGGLFADPFGMADHAANGQTLMTRTPSVLAAPAAYAPMPGYNSVPAYNAVPRYSPTPAYDTQPAPTPYRATAYPAIGSSPTYAQAALYPFQPASTQPSWPCEQLDDGQSSVLQGRSKFLGGSDGPALASPQGQLPAPASPSGPNNQMQSQGMPGNAAPGYAAPGNAAPGYAAPGYAAPGNAAPGYAAPGNAAPGYAAPGYAAPGYAAPGYAAPGNAAPGYAVPGYAAPGYAVPGYAAPGYAVPGYAAPGYAVPGYAVPGYAAPGYAAPGYAVPGYAASGYEMPGYPYGGSARDVWASGYASMYGQPAVRNWFGSVGGLVMTRDHADQYTFSYGTGDEADQRTDTRNADMQWGGGFDVRFGRYFNCQRNAIEAVYWGIFPASQSTQTVSADVFGDLNGILNWNNLDYDGFSADVYVNVAPGFEGIHRLTRDYAFHNLELNLWQFCGSCGTGNRNSSRLQSNWLVGVRYFRFDENLHFVSDANDLYITNEYDEINYNIDIENHLIGFQVGNEAQYCMSDRLTADLGIKFGLYANQINHISQIGGIAGAATINNGPWLGEAFYVNNSKNDVAFLGEVNLGLRYCISCCWTGTLGYRALAVTGVAMPADQIYPDLRGINDVANIDSSRAMILHGGYAGLEYNW